MSKSITYIFIFFLLLIQNLKGQPFCFMYEKTPLNSGFKMEDYWIWCGSIIKVDSTYHLFASRWPKNTGFPEGYRQNSEIVQAISNNPLGPFTFEKIIIGERDSNYWDANMAHNPTIHKIGDEYVLFYIGSDFTTFRPNSNSLLRRVGYAKAKSIHGPWIRSNLPLLNFESNNPAILVNNNKVYLVFRDERLKVSMAEAKHYMGPYTIINDNIYPNCKLEDFYLFKANNSINMICEDNMGEVSGHERWGVHLVTENEKTEWKKHNPLIVYNHDLVYENDSVLHCIRRERPQLLIENNEITYLITTIFNGKNSWSQPVKLKKSIPLK